MNQPTHPIKAGTLISVTSGEYSDYGLNGFFVALQDFDPFDIQRDILAQNDKDRRAAEEAKTYYGDYATMEKFLPECIRRGLLLEIQPTNFHLGDFGKLNLEVG